IRARAQGNIGLRQHVALEIDPRCDLTHHQPILFKSDDAAFGHVGDLLAALACDAPTERDVFGGLDELAAATFLDDLEASVADLQFGAGGEKSGEDDAPRVRGDVDEATAARGEIGACAKLGYVDAAGTIDLHERQQRAVEAAALEVGELV